MRVLVIPEDPTHNGYILKPLVEAVLSDAGKARAKVLVLPNPRLSGFDHACEAIRMGLLDRYGFYDLWLFMPDADRATPAAMDALERTVAERGVTLFVCPAQPEVEIYASVACRHELNESWDSLRRHSRFKEDVFGAILRRHGNPQRAGGGRDLLIAESLRNLRALFDLCPELKVLRDRIAAMAAAE